MRTNPNRRTVRQPVWPQTAWHLASFSTRQPIPSLHPEPTVQPQTRARKGCSAAASRSDARGPIRIGAASPRGRSATENHSFTRTRNPPTPSRGGRSHRCSQPRLAGALHRVYTVCRKTPRPRETVPPQQNASHRQAAPRLEQRGPRATHRVSRSQSATSGARSHRHPPRPKTSLTAAASRLSNARNPLRCVR